METLEKNLQELKLQHLKAQGDTQNSSATVHRLQTQLNVKQQDVELMVR